MYVEELSSIVQKIINSGTVPDHIDAAKNLSDFYKRITADNKTFYLAADNEQYIVGGQALSTLHAADCTDDYLRTVYFIKGINKALLQLADNLPEKEINILYAGCGPFATLLLPLLPLFHKKHINAILIDINHSSLLSVRELIAILGFEEYNLKLVEADATIYQKPADWNIDLLLSETMHYALIREPQVAIVKNFLPQLLPHSIIIPQEITIDLAYSFYSKEPFLNEPGTGQDNIHYPCRYSLSRLFKVCKDQNQSLVLKDNLFKSPIYSIPDDFSVYPDICLFTEVKVFEDIELKTAESFITNPYCVTSLYNSKAHSGFQLVYDYNDVPEWTCIFL